MRALRTVEAPPIEGGDAESTFLRTFASALARPYPVTAPMVALIVLVPFYIFIAQWNVGRALHVPEIALDRSLPLAPAWALVYGTVYLFLILLPVLVVRTNDHVRAMFLAYLAVWLTAYVIFLVYPTRAPRPEIAAADGFVAWGIRFLYSSDPPYNCFPSLHVAHSFVSALSCYRVHERVGMAGLVGASLVGLSTLFTKQHYVIDVIAGAMLAWAACTIFLRWPRDIASVERRVAPAVAAWTGVAIGALFALAWLAYEVTHL